MARFGPAPDAWRRLIKRSLPTTLYGRTFLIIVLPVALMQLAVAWVFFDAHWRTVTMRLSEGLAGDIAWALESYEDDPTPAGLAHLAGAVRLECRGVPAPTEIVRRLGEALDGPDLVADEEEGDPGEDQGRRRHPAQEDQALGGHGALLGRQNPEDPATDLYADVHIGRVAGGVEPERGVDPRRQGLPELGVHRRQGVPAAGLRQGPVRQEGDGQAHGPFRAARRPCQAGRGRIILVAFEGPGDVAGQAL